MFKRCCSVIAALLLIGAVAMPLALAPPTRRPRRPVRSRGARRLGSTAASRTSRATSSSSTATCWCSRRSCCSPPTRRWRCSCRWTSASCSSSTRCRSSSTTSSSPTTCTRRSKCRRCIAAACSASTSATCGRRARDRRLLHRQGPARPRLQARRDGQVRQGHRPEVHRAAHQGLDRQAAARVRRQGLAIRADPPCACAPPSRCRCGA